MSRKWGLRNTLEKEKKHRTKSQNFNAQSETGKKEKENGEKTVKTRNEPQKLGFYIFFHSIFFAGLTLD